MAFDNITVQGAIDLNKEGFEMTINDGEVKAIEKSNYCSDDCSDGCAQSEFDQDKRNSLRN